MPRKSTVDKLLEEIREQIKKKRAEEEKKRGRPSSIPRDPEVYERIARLFEEGFTIAEVAKALGVNERTIRRLKEDPEFQKFLKEREEKIKAARMARAQVVYDKDLLEKIVSGEAWNKEACRQLSPWEPIQDVCMQWVVHNRSRQSLKSAVEEMAEIYEFQCKVKQKCDPSLWEADDFLEFANSLISRGVSTDTVRKYLTRWWAWKPEHREKLKGLHGKWVRRGVMKTEEHVLEPEEVKAALESDELTDEEKLYLKLWLTTGAREYSKPSTRGLKELGWGGIVGAKVSDINWKDCTIAVREPKTGKEEAKEWYGIQLNLFFPTLCQELRQYVEEHGRRGDDWLWGSPERGVKLYKSIIKKLRKLTGKPLVPHDIRRTHAYWLVKADVPLELIAGGVTGQKLYNALGVGWEDISVMIRYYADLAGKSRKFVPVVQQAFHQIFA